MKTTSENMAMVLNPPKLSDCTDWAPRDSCSSLQMLRLDELHPIVSGNKLFKLKYNIEAARSNNKNSLLSFGGGHSNHLVALAAAAKMWGLGSIGLVRGHYPEQEITSTLRACKALGMELHYLSKKEYSDSAYMQDQCLAEKFPDAYIIPEGGANENGIKGAAEIATFLPPSTTHVCVAVGSGCTLAGLQRGLPSTTKSLGFCAAKQCTHAQNLIDKNALTPAPEMHPMLYPHFGKWTEQQIYFMQDFWEKTGIKTDVVYTGKMMQKVAQMLATGYFPPGSRIVCLHTGGLQGNPESLF